MAKICCHAYLRDTRRYADAAAAAYAYAAITLIHAFYAAYL